MDACGIIKRRITALMMTHQDLVSRPIFFSRFLLLDLELRHLAVAALSNSLFLYCTVSVTLHLGLDSSKHFLEEHAKWKASNMLVYKTSSPA